VTIYYLEDKNWPEISSQKENKKRKQKNKQTNKRKLGM
jgi:hypothetical protein